MRAGVQACKQKPAFAKCPSRVLTLGIKPVFVKTQRLVNANAVQGIMFCAPSTLTIIFGTETGTASFLAEQALVASTQIGLPARLADMATYNTYRLTSERFMLFITSTHGDGDPPQSASDFFEFLDETADLLHGMRFGLLALGDSGYDDFCGAGKHIDGRLQALGAVPVLTRRDIDVGELKLASDWIADFVQTVAASQLSS